MWSSVACCSYVCIVRMRRLTTSTIQITHFHPTYSPAMKVGGSYMTPQAGKGYTTPPPSNTTNRLSVWSQAHSPIQDTRHNRLYPDVEKSASWLFAVGKSPDERAGRPNRQEKSEKAREDGQRVDHVVSLNHSTSPP